MADEIQENVTDVDAFKCIDCRYIHTTHTGKEPKECVQCGSTSFRQVDDNATNRSKEGPFDGLLEDTSRAGLALYIVFILIVLIGIFGTLLLVVL